ncbi:MAG: hypothetical protein JWN32_2283 [Solirubrobacterales bacterium]|nr:hypothetical protein [Solirubrobacterales bacterium]
MAQAEEELARQPDPDEELVLVRPNRDKAAAKTTKMFVILILLVSAALVAIVTVGGWSKLQGAQAVQIAYILIYIVMAFYVARWNRGVLPVAAALGIILGIFAAVAGPGWFDRDKAGFAPPDSLFGGQGLDVNVLGLITLLIVPVQALLIAVAMQGFRQNWHVEVEMPRDVAQRKYGRAVIAGA